MQGRTDDRSLGELFADLARDMGILVRQEVGLATTEMTYKASRLGQDLAVVAAGALVLYAGLLAIIATIIIGLATAGLPWWLAALLVGLIVIGVGGVILQRGINSLKHADLAPRQTMETLKEDTQWAKEQMT
ncbi:MAG: phage holin family protein [Chloroflexi bacterium]|nr:phage holin family protein [Chloroflexota bacterium]MBV9602904.1 phage holin family protein [Chloroflexota bacterium]